MKFLDAVFESVLRRIRNIVISLVPDNYWDKLAQSYSPNKRFHAVTYRLIWWFIFRGIYDNDKRDKLFQLICRYYYKYPIKKGDIVVQIGASEGEETIRFSKAVGETGHVIAIKPIIQNFEQIKKKLASYSIKNVTAINMGAYNKADTIDFLVAGPKEHRIAKLGAQNVGYKDWEGNYIEINEDFYKEKITVPVDTLPNIFEKNNIGFSKFNYVLIETNGSEHEVIKGMESMLNKVERLTARAHVELDGVELNKEIRAVLQNHGFITELNFERDVIAYK